MSQLSYLNDGSTLGEKTHRLRKTLDQEFFHVRVRSVAACDPQDLWRLAQTVDQIDKVAVFADDDCAGRSRTKKNVFVAAPINGKAHNRVTGNAKCFFDLRCQ